MLNTPAVAPAFTMLDTELALVGKVWDEEGPTASRWVDVVWTVEEVGLVKGLTVVLVIGSDEWVVRETMVMAVT